MPNNKDNNNFALGIPDYSFEDLCSPSRLRDLFNTFGETVKQHDSKLFAEYQQYHACSGEDMTPQAVSDLLIRMAPYVGQFVAKLFNIEQEHAEQQNAIIDEVNSIFVFRNEIVGKLKTKFKKEDINQWNIQSIQQNFDLLKRVGFPDENADPDLERSTCRVGTKLVQLSNHYSAISKDKPSQYSDADTQVNKLRDQLQSDTESSNVFAQALTEQNPADFINAMLEYVQRWSYAVHDNPELTKIIEDWTCFKTPKKTDFQHLVEHEINQRDGFTTWIGSESEHRRRDGFGLTDKRYNQRQVKIL